MTGTSLLGLLLLAAAVSTADVNSSFEIGWGRCGRVSLGRRGPCLALVQEGPATALGHFSSTRIPCAGETRFCHHGYPAAVNLSVGLVLLTSSGPEFTSLKMDIVPAPPTPIPRTPGTCVSVARPPSHGLLQAPVCSPDYEYISLSARPDSYALRISNSHFHTVGVGGSVAWTGRGRVSGWRGLAAPLVLTPIAPLYAVTDPVMVSPLDPETPIFLFTQVQLDTLQAVFLSKQPSSSFQITALLEDGGRQEITVNVNQGVPPSCILAAAGRILLPAGSSAPLKAASSIPESCYNTKVNILVPPSFGLLLVKNNSATSFTLGQLRSGGVLYVHSGRRVGPDNIVLASKSGVSWVYAIEVYRSKVGPVSILYSGKLRLGNSTTALLDSTVIAASSLHSSPYTIAYTVLNTTGKFLVRKKETTKWTEGDVREGVVEFEGSFEEDVILSVGGRRVSLGVTAVNHEDEKLSRHPGLRRLEVAGPTTLEVHPGLPGHALIRPSRPDTGAFLVHGLPASAFTVAHIRHRAVQYHPPLIPHPEHLLLSIPYTIYAPNSRQLVNKVLTIELKQPFQQALSADQPFNYVSKKTSKVIVEEGDSVLLSKTLLGIKGEMEFTLDLAPSHGEIMSSDVPVTSFSSQDLDSDDVVYSHNGREIGRTKTEDRFSLKNSLNQLIDVKVVIEPVDDCTPEVRILGSEPLLVNEGDRIEISSFHLLVKDPDTEDEDILCHVTSPPKFGYIENSSSPNNAGLTYFTNLDVLQGNLEYVQSMHKGVEVQNDSFTLMCNDPYNNSDSASHNSGTVLIKILPVNDEVPQFKTREISIKPMTPIALSSAIYDVYDLDNPTDELIFTVRERPSQGNLYENSSNKLVKASQFSASLLDDIIYLPDNHTDTPDDSFVLTLSDGLFAKTAEVRVKLLNANKIPPHISLNNGLTVHLGGRAVISSSHLLSESSNSGAEKLFYLLKDPPLFGQLLNGEQQLGPGSKFTQSDINRHRICYTNTDSTSLIDVFGFDLFDGTLYLPNQNFFITLSAGNMTYPVVESKVPVISVGSSLLLNDQVLQVKLGSNVSFHIVSAPNQGRIERVDNPGVSVSSFSEEDLRLGRIEYVHAGKAAMGPEIVQLEVRSGGASVFHSFKIDVVGRPRAAGPPFSHVAVRPRTTAIGPMSFRRLPNGRLGAPIPSFGSDPSPIEYIVTSPPTLGQIVFQEKVITSFSSDALDREEIVYIPRNEQESNEDFFMYDAVYQSGFTVTGNQVTFHWDGRIWFEEAVYRFKEGSKSSKICAIRGASAANSPASYRLSQTKGNASEYDDYILPTKSFVFSPAENKSCISIEVLEDSISEGTEEFMIQIATNVSTKVIIKDGLSVTQLHTQPIQLAEVSLAESVINVKEDAGNVTIYLLAKNHWRPGTVSVKLETFDLSAKDNEDYVGEERTVKLGWMDGRRGVTLKILDDEPKPRRESQEYFVVRLSQPVNCTLGPIHEAKVVIDDPEDEERIEFTSRYAYVKEPSGNRLNNSLKAHISRKGDASGLTSVLLTTEEGSAKAGKDFHPISQTVIFNPGVIRKEVEVFVLGDDEVETQETFSICLNSTKSGGHKMTIFIYDYRKNPVVVFPTPPVVMSLADYVSSEENGKPLKLGIPIICATVCDPKHDKYAAFSKWCSDNGINEKNTIYRWQVETQIETMSDIKYRIFYADANERVLDSVYLHNGTILRCGARPTVQGRESFSDSVTITGEMAACPPPSPNTIGAQPFIAHLDYVDESGYGRKPIKLQITLPHYDGMFPAVSSRPLLDLPYSQETNNIVRFHHKCSNLDLNDNNGLSLINKFGSEVSTFENYQQNSSNRLYRHLNLANCEWKFINHYEINQMISECKGTVNSEEKYDSSLMILKMPLFVSYVTPTPSGFRHTDLHTVLRLKFSYETTLMSHDNVFANSINKLDALLFPTSMFISEAGLLNVYFKTEPKFPGYFLMHHPVTSSSSKVISKEYPDLNLSLKLISNSTRGKSYHQVWKFFSKTAMSDYSGSYEIQLIPCLFSEEEGSPCVPELPLSYPLDIQLQQIAEELPRQYTLDTSFHIIKKRQAKRHIPSDQSTGETSGEVQLGDQIYGFISLKKFQNQLALKINKCYICNGKFGFIPRYSPKDNEFGCLSESDKLLHVFKIIDREDPFSVVTKFHNRPFQAILLEVNHLADEEMDHFDSDSDVFSFDPSPLFAADAGRLWFVQCTYKVESVSEQNLRKKRNLDRMEAVGTNMHRILLSVPPPSNHLTPSSPPVLASFTPPSTIIIAALSFAVTSLCFLLFRNRAQVYYHACKQNEN